MHHPGSTEWPIWHDYPGRDRQERGAPSRHDIALAGYLETQQAHRASMARRLDPAAMTASALAAFVGRVFVQRCAQVSAARPMPWPGLSKAHAVFSKTLWRR
ncbi:hypothetical protein ACWGTI_19785 [Mesorhizobium sp. ArgA1]